ncbi:nitrate- and nitrite sensing domain-containing protein [Streptomyces sp. DSM 15324]|uniref:sensor histidine kinase n=1 Tax=Streptomyces sp. DSM 15324 TaxID=1739111 RepID=UPI0007495E2C|nr:nitrate- and nitrite sensing domain-containing protein [Streptomyces sp. DSM 15324]KUO12768.1 histidine kinase [Streptomyces sp. DSM 15324]
MSPRTGARRRRLGSIRLSLILLALVPSVTLAAMWGVTTIQMFSEGMRLRAQTQLSRSTGAMGTEAAIALQQERSLSAVWLASGGDAARTALDAQRRRTDTAVAKLVSRADDIQQAPERVKDQLYSVVASVSSLEYYRGQVDHPTGITAAQALDQYTSIIDVQIHAFQALSQVDDGDLTSQAGPLVALEHAAELVSEEDLRLTLAGPEGRMDQKTWAQFVQLVNTRRWLVEDQIVPSLTGAAKTETEKILTSYQWQILQSIEDKVLAAGAERDKKGLVVLPDVQKQWRAALIEVSDQYAMLIQRQTVSLLQNSADDARALLIKAASLSAGGLVALLLCVGMSWRITRSLSRRLRGLRMATLSLAQERLPDVVARLDRGETVDVESATPPLDYGGDELGQVATAFNAAQRTAVHTAVELADTRRGFQKVILGIARQSQNLVNLQLSKLDALERTHQDPEVLKGLYELDSTASQLRRYEENLVIISGGRPGRSWSEPVALIDILRSAVGEVAQYQRVEVHAEEDLYIAPPAVADVIHLLAELIDNATSYSPPPSPVAVRASTVAKGLAIEVEDRGLGLSEEDYESFNAQLAVPPQFDVVALADDLRLGMFVIARLATRHGIAVTLRPSPYGGVTAIVLVPHDIVVRETTAPLPPAAAEPTGPEPTRSEPTAADPAAAEPVDTIRRLSEALRRFPDEQAPVPADGTDEVPAESGTAVRRAGADEPPPPPTPTPTPTPGPDPEHARPHGERPAPLPRRDKAAAIQEASAPAGGPRNTTRTPAYPAAPAAAPGLATAGAGARPAGLRPLPQRVPQTSLAAELREEAPTCEEDGFPDDFTAERAASSLAGFQRGTLQARDHEDADADSAVPPPGPAVTAAGATQTPTPPADRS